MNNQNSLISTAMLAAIWDKEQKDTLELLIPFVIYSIGKTVSLGGAVENIKISEQLEENFGLYKIPDAVVHKAFIRLSKRKILQLQNKKFYLCMDVTQRCRDIDAQRMAVENQTTVIISALQEYLNSKKAIIFKRDMTIDDTKEYFARFLESKGYFAYVDVNKLRSLSMAESVLNYHIANFIINEFEKRSELFRHIDSVIKGLMLSSIIYLQTEIDCLSKIKNTDIYFDSALLLQIFGFKSPSENRSSAQLIELLKSLSTPMKCFEHNFSEVYKILDAYKFNILHPEKRYGQTLEYFDSFSYTSSDMDRVLSNLTSYFEAKDIEIVPMPSYSNDMSGIVTEQDYGNFIGEIELKKHLSDSIHYRNEEALNNDVNSISAIHILRKGNQFEKIESCKAIFVTTNPQLAFEVRRYVNGNRKSAPLAISDLDFVTFLWLKNYKNHSGLPTLKLIENARLSMEPTEYIRQEFAKKIEQIQHEPQHNFEMAATYRQLIYIEKEKVMELIEGSPENISRLELVDLEQIAATHYHEKLSNENRELKLERDETHRRLVAESTRKINRWRECLERLLKVAIYTLVFGVSILGVVGTIMQFVNHTGLSVINSILLLFGLVGICDTIFSRFRFINRLIAIACNKLIQIVEKRENEHIRKILDPKNEQ